MGRLDGKVAIISGASFGIGKASAILLAQEGAEVTVACRTVEAGEETVSMIRTSGGKAIFIRTDVSKPRDVMQMVKSTVETYGKLDILFNNAGVQGELSLLADLSEEVYDRFMDTNTKGVWLGMKYAIPEMIKNDGGSIINMSSICALVSVKGYCHYSASKAAIMSLSSSAAVDYGPQGIRVNCICPGPIQTRVQDELQKTDPETYHRWESLLPLRRFGKPEEVARLVLFLASDESSYVTGSALTIDGGLTALSPINFE